MGNSAWLAAADWIKRSKHARLHTDDLCSKGRVSFLEESNGKSTVEQSYNSKQIEENNRPTGKRKVGVITCSCWDLQRIGNRKLTRESWGIVRWCHKQGGRCCSSVTLCLLIRWICYYVQRINDLSLRNQRSTVGSARDGWHQVCTYVHREGDPKVATTLSYGYNTHNHM